MGKDGQILRRFGEDHASPGDDAGPFGPLQHQDRVVDVAVIELVLHADDALRLPRAEIRDSRSNILGDVHQHRARPAALGDLEGAADRGRQLLHVLDDKAVLGDGEGDPGDVDLLEGILPEQRQADVAGDRDERDRIHMSGGDAGDQVGRAGSAGSEADAHLSGGAGVPVRGVGSALFVAGQDMMDLVLMLVERVIDVQDRPARITEDSVDSLLLQAFDHDLGTIQFCHGSCSPYSLLPVFIPSSAPGPPGLRPAAHRSRALCSVPGSRRLR